jgi:diadenosine tetraphosphate (Ap4A) HIT family hydrolase
MFRTVFPSIIRSLRLYIQHQVYVMQVSGLLASGNEMELHFHLVPASEQPQNLYDVYLMLYVRGVSQK